MRMKRNILDKIVTAQRLRVEQLKTAADGLSMAEKARTFRSDMLPNRLSRSLSDASRINVIAEYKRASPSKGLINNSIGPKDAAKAYQRGGAAAISVLTEVNHFLGSLNDLAEVRSSVSLPILRKDFIVDEFQVIESAVAGADAILLIVAALSTSELKNLLEVTLDLGMDALVEVHSVGEMEIAVDAGAKLIGVNNRNLQTLEVSLDVARTLIDLKRPGTLFVCESGISLNEEITEFKRLGYDGFLIGETLMRSSDPENELRDLIG